MRKHPNWEEWFLKAQKGNRGAYERLLNEITPAIRRYVKKAIKDSEAAEAVVEDALLSMHLARHTYRPPLSFENWLFALTRRSLERYWTRYPLLQAILPVSTPAPMPIDTEKVFSSLSPEHQKALRLLKLKGLTVEQAAAQCGMDVGSFKSLAMQAKKKLREAIEEKRKAS